MTTKNHTEYGEWPILIQYDYSTVYNTILNIPYGNVAKFT